MHEIHALVASNESRPTEVNRRSALKEGLLLFAGLGTLVAGGSLFDAARSRISLLSPDERDFLQKVSQANIEWRRISDPNATQSQWVGHFGEKEERAVITLSAWRHQHGEKRTIEVTEARTPFSYNCPSWRHYRDDRALVDALFAQARGVKVNK